MLLSGNEMVDCETDEMVDVMRNEMVDGRWWDRNDMVDEMVDG